jgi:hypothetical protein
MAVSKQVTKLRLLGLISIATAAAFALPGGLPTAYGAEADESALAIVNRYVEACHAQEPRLRGVTMTIDIQAELPKLKKQGRFHALRVIPKVGKITYEALGFEGDKTIKTDVIARYLQAEDQAQMGDPSLMAITPQNYKFKYKGQDTLGGRSAHVFQLTPRKKRLGLFKGELWVDTKTYLPLREIGRLVKNPSVFLKRVEFVRDFEIRDGVAVPRRILSQVETRVVGPAELAINFSDIKPEAGGSACVTPSGGEAH